MTLYQIILVLVQVPLVHGKICFGVFSFVNLFDRDGHSNYGKLDTALIFLHNIFGHGSNYYLNFFLRALKQSLILSRPVEISLVVLSQYSTNIQTLLFVVHLKNKQLLSMWVRVYTYSIFSVIRRIYMHTFIRPMIII